MLLGVAMSLAFELGGKFGFLEMGIIASTL